MTNLVSKLRCPWNRSSDLSFVQNALTVLNRTQCSPIRICQVQGGFQKSISLLSLTHRFMQNWRGHNAEVSVFWKFLGNIFNTKIFSPQGYLTNDNEIVSLFSVTCTNLYLLNPLEPYLKFSSLLVTLWSDITLISCIKF